MARVKTFTNGGTLLPADLNSIEDDYETLFASYRVLMDSHRFHVGAGTTAGTYLLEPFATGAIASGAGVVPVYFDPADYSGGTRTCRLRVRATFAVNAVLTAANFVVGLYPLTAAGGASGTGPAVTIGTVVAGSTVTSNNPAASAVAVQVGADFAAPAAGYYGLGFTVSATTAASSQCVISGYLEQRWT